MTHAWGFAKTCGAGVRSKIRKSITGRTINIISEKAEGEVFGFDTFTGLPEDWGDGWQAKGVFSQDGKLPEVNDNVELIVGLFQDTLELFLEEYPHPAAYIHIDCDLYSSSFEALNVIAQQLIAKRNESRLEIDGRGVSIKYVHY